MGFTTRIDTARNDQAETGETAAGDDAPHNSPFSMDYDLSDYDPNEAAIDRGLSLLIAVTNLL